MYNREWTPVRDTGWRSARVVSEAAGSFRALFDNLAVVYGTRGRRRSVMHPVHRMHNAGTLALAVRYCVAATCVTIVRSKNTACVCTGSSPSAGIAQLRNLSCAALASRKWLRAIGFGDGCELFGGPENFSKLRAGAQRRGGASGKCGPRRSLGPRDLGLRKRATPRWSASRRGSRRWGEWRASDGRR